MIDELERAVGGMHRNEAGDGVNDQPKTLGAEAQSVFGGCAIFKNIVPRRSPFVGRDRVDKQSIL